VVLAVVSEAAKKRRSACDLAYDSGGLNTGISMDGQKSKLDYLACEVNE
jgi:hypothetical protein